MPLFGGRGGGESRAQRSAAERERARIERERRRAMERGETPPPAPEPPAAEAPPVQEPPPAQEPPRVQEPPVQEPPPAPPPPPPPPAPEPEPQPSWFGRAEEPAPPPPPAPPVAPEPEPFHQEPEPEPVEQPTGSEEPIGIRRVAGRSVRDLPQVAGPNPRRPRPPKQRPSAVDEPARRVPLMGSRGAPRPRRTGRRVLGVLVLAVAAVAVWFVVSLFQPFAGDGEGSVRVTVPEGSGPGDVAQILADEGVVGSRFFFELRTRLAGESSNLRAGTFTLRKDMSYAAAIDALTTAPPPKVLKVTVPEGRARTEIVPLLKGSGLRGDYLRASVARRSVLRKYGAPRDTGSLEGFLYPATYELKVGSTARDLVDQQLQAFEEMARRTKLRSRARRLDLDGYQVLSIASMIEREVIVPRERRLVSAVIHNRLEQGIPLGIDATIRYRLRNWDRPLRQSELQIDSGYNTRTRQGLPPTPIGNPGEASIEAALRPAKVDHLFYVVKPCGRGAHAFSATDEQFQRDVAAYNRAREARGGRDPSEC